ncbi:MAG TPA: PaaI family thioesterase [Gammaproteobacteria bacterium]|nr:PaaI family thioesterase [Gammaproteobacteria bacterium]
MNQQSLQEQFAPENICFGCGPSNTQGLRIKSFVKGQQVIANWQAEKYHEAFPGILNGGIIGTLLDCHANWTAAYFLMQSQQLDRPPCTVTSYFNVKLKKPTPSDKAVHLIAQPLEIQNDRAKILAQLYSDGVLCAECEGLFVAVKPNHPAYQRW